MATKPHALPKILTNWLYREWFLVAFVGCQAAITLLKVVWDKLSAVSTNFFSKAE